MSRNRPQFLCFGETGIGRLVKSGSFWKWRGKNWWFFYFKLPTKKTQVFFLDPKSHVFFPRKNGKPLWSIIIRASLRSSKKRLEQITQQSFVLALVSRGQLCFGRLKQFAATNESLQSKVMLSIWGKPATRLFFGNKKMIFYSIYYINIYVSVRLSLPFRELTYPFFKGYLSFLEDNHHCFFEIENQAGLLGQWWLSLVPKL